MTDANRTPRPERSFRLFLVRNGLFLSATLLLLFINLYLLATSQQGDALIAINRLRSPFYDYLFMIGTRFGEPVAYTGVLLIVGAVSYRRAVFTVVTGAMAGILAGVFKLIFRQPRPHRWFFDNFEGVWHNLNHFGEEWRSWDETGSFPSGHTTSAFALYAFLAFNARTGKIPITLLCFLLAILVGFSRMYLLFHFLRDVTAGALLGVLVAMVGYYAQHRTLRNWPALDRGWADRFRTLPPVRSHVDLPPD